MKTNSISHKGNWIRPKRAESVSSNLEAQNRESQPRESLTLSRGSDQTSHSEVGKFQWNPDNRFAMALQGVGTVFSGLASYAGLSKPVAERYKREGVPEREPTSPSVIAMLEQPLGEGMQICPKEQAAYRALNADLDGLYPTLNRALSEPDAFKADLRARFEKQKDLTPEDPYSFDFSDYAVPVFQQVGQAIDKEISKLNTEVESLKHRRFTDKQVAERKVGLDYLTDLGQELDERIESQDFSYRRTQELGYFAACALGHFDMGQIHPRDRLLLKIDSFLQSEDKVGIQEEYRRYKDNEFTVFQKPAHAFSGFDRVERPFEQAFFNPEKMELFNLPTLEPLGEEPFMRLQNKDIFLSGIAAEPLSADGFDRQGRLFWLHDVRHNSAIFSKKKAYLEERNLNSEQIKKLDRRIDVWNSELKKSVDEIEDPQLISAVETVIFSVHHDRGLPMVPSTYESDQLRPVTKALRLMWGVSGQDQRFDSPRKNLKLAYNWVDEFWSSRREQEREIVGC